MIVIPSIDILDGKCVRLFQGDYGKVTDYGDTPESMAAGFQDAGASRLHVVDLDAARGLKEGRKHNRDIIRAIRSSFSGTVEVGGGIRSESDINELLEVGVDRLIVGTILARKPEVVAKWIALYGSVFVGGIDAMDGEVKVSGWEKGTGLKATVLAAMAKKLGIISIVYTNIKNDGTLSGPDIEGTDQIGNAAELPVIVSGGVSSIEDLHAIAEFNSKYIAGAISGKAVYEGRLNIGDALKAYGRDAEERLW